MRGKFIAVFSGIVLIVGGLTFALLRVSLGELVAYPAQARNDAVRSAAAANAQLQLEALNFQRWLDEQSNEKQTREPFFRENESVRSDQATAQADRIFGLAASEFRATPPSLVAYVDDKGVALGRNGSTLFRGENLGAAYPALLATLAKGATGSDVWVSKVRNEQILVSYAAIRDGNNRVLGALLLGTPLNDGRLSRLSEVTSGRPLVFVAPSGDVIAKSGNVPSSILGFLEKNARGSAAVTTLLQAQQPQQLGAAPEHYAAFGVALAGYGDGRRAAILAFSPVALVESITSELLPIVGVAMMLGLLLVTIGSILLSNYISRPIVELETGILAIINGQTERRFEIEHAELGGLVFSINSLLNHLMGVQEDMTDADGRPSREPSTQQFQEALSVDSLPTNKALDPSLVRALAEEAKSSYYRRLFGEYIEAKKSVGDPVEHITEQAFVQRMQASEAEAEQRQGNPVRYRVEVRGREVMLIAVPLPQASLKNVLSSIRKKRMTAKRACAAHNASRFCSRFLDKN